MTDLQKAYKATVDTEHVPKDLREFDGLWVVWAPEQEKQPLAPWDTGHMYPCEWAAGKANPRQSFSKAKMIVDMPIKQVAHNWTFPDNEQPSVLKPAVLLPHEWPADTTPLVFVDFDDVRDPDSGVVPDEVWDLVQSLGGYTEVSRSGTGLHVWVRGELPGGLGKFIQSLDTRGQIEMYDHGRMTGGTWKHVEGTPLDKIPKAQDVIEDVINKYGDEDDGDKIARRELPQSHSSSAGGNRNAFYNLDLAGVADQGPFRHNRTDSRNPASSDWQGPHPAHGGTKTPDQNSTNFKVDGDLWHCFAHEDGGGALSLVAVLEVRGVSCGNAKQIHQDNRLLLKACLAARDEYDCSLENERPPYGALVAVAREFDLLMADSEAGILGKDGYRIARTVFDELSQEDLR